VTRERITFQPRHFLNNPSPQGIEMEVPMLVLGITRFEGILLEVKGVAPCERFHDFVCNRRMLPFELLR
jgi:hypothetical protein